MQRSGEHGIVTFVDRSWPTSLQIGSFMHFAEPNRSAVSVADARRMTSAQLRQLGVPRVVYLRSRTFEGQTACAIHAADGTAMAVVEDTGVACELASENDMTLVSVH
jgi:hypothetical protein